MNLWNSVIATIEFMTQEVSVVMQALGHKIVSAPHTQLAAADQAISASNTPVADTTNANTAATSQSTTQPAVSQPSAQTIIEYIPQNDSALAARVNSIINILGSVTSLIPTSSQTQTNTPFPQQVAANGNPDVPYAAASNIGNLSNVTISNA
ncbi:MAG: hypothetical protein P4L81_02555, partial [Candidatus Pacebacteria bacterium]|nr:hypothetical protein [Candidatus Paceibacterota bacterium]